MIGRRRDDAHAFHEAWENGTSIDGELADLVDTADWLSLASTVQPSPEFISTLRERVMTEAQTVLISNPAAWRDPSPRVVVPVRERPRARRRLAGLTAATLATVGSVSLVATSAQALPGEMLYPVKQGVENVQLVLKDDGPERGGYQLDRASERLREAEVLAADARADDRLADVLDSFVRSAQEGSTTLFDDYSGSGDTASIDRVSSFATRATTTLSAFDRDAMSPEVESSWQAAAQTISGLAEESSRLCATCDPADVDDLVRSVSAAAQAPEPAPADRPERETSDDRSEASAGSPSVAPEPTAPRPTAAASDPPPAPSPTPTRKPGLRGVTDPLVGGLLGDEEQEGLVPGLLGGLLGGGKQ